MALVYNVRAGASSVAREFSPRAGKEELPMGYRGRHKARSRFHLLFVILCCLALLMLAYPFLEPFLLETESVTLTSADLPEDVGQLKIVYVSDIHQGAYFSQGRVRSLVTRINSLNPDIILLGGDYANTSEEAIAFFQSAPSFHARYLTAAVVGNHDRTAPENNLEALQQAMYDAGIVPLVNSVNRLKIGTDYIYLAGIDDVDNGWPDLEGVAAQVDRNDYVIFLSHSPAILGKALDARDRDGDKGWFDLALCGHTHGGQVTLLGQPILESARTSGRYWRGWYEANRAYMLVSNGVGTSGLPIRLFAQPQIHLITIRHGS